jgi:chromosomal replication initiation ATPase DnaA
VAANDPPVQLVLDLAHRAALGAEDFLVSASNAAAVALIDRWPDWPHPALALVGPAGAGKSHLANVWRLRSGADACAARDISDAYMMARATDRGILVEDIDRGLGDERALFHLINAAREHKFHVLVTGRTAPGEWQLELPDLRSRLRSAPVAIIGAPDDALLQSVLVKLFADRQLTVEPHVIAHLAPRMERSMEMAQRLVAAIDERALQQQRRVTRALAGEVLAALGGAASPEEGE